MQQQMAFMFETVGKGKNRRLNDICRERLIGLAGELAYGVFVKSEFNNIKQREHQFKSSYIPIMNGRNQELN